MNYIKEIRSIIGNRPLIIAGAAVLIFDQGDNLLLQRRQDNQQWGLIGGSMEIGESLAETAIREVKEETGLTLDQLDWFDLFSGQELIYEYPHGDIVVNVTAVYISRQYRRTLKIDKKEVSEIRFFKLSKLPENISPPDKPVIKKYLNSLKI
jgi:8-oxo-dGTP pyrophosphatase MutT (NUDIX family)